MTVWMVTKGASLVLYARTVTSSGGLTALAPLELLAEASRVVLSGRKTRRAATGTPAVSAGEVAPADPTGDEPRARNGLRRDATGNDDLVAERIGPLAHNDRYSLSCRHVLMRSAVMPDPDGLVVRHTEVDGKNPSAPPLAELARPLVGQYVIGGDRHRKHAARPEARGLGLDACMQDATQEPGGREVHKSSHASSICLQAPRVKDDVAQFSARTLTREMDVQPGVVRRMMKPQVRRARGGGIVSALPIPPRRWRLIGGIGVVLVVAVIAGLLILHQREAGQATVAGVCAPQGSNAVSTSTVSMAPPGVTLPVTIPAGEPSVVATVNGDPLYAEGLELRVQGALANHRQQLQQSPPGSLPPNVAATLQETSNQIRHDMLTQMIQECLLLQEGKRLGLIASTSAAQAMARQQLQLINSMPATDPARVSFEQYLQASHLTEQTFVTDPGILQGYRNALTTAAVRQHIRAGLPPGESATSGINAYIQHLWQTGNVRVYLPASLGW